MSSSILYTIRITEVVVADDDKKAISVLIFDWLKGQPFNNVLLLLILGGGTWLVVDRVPEHLNMIQNGYREVIDTVTKQHMEERAEILKNHREERERTQQMYNNWLGRPVGVHSRDSPPVVAQP
jgi:predicted AAA+ superfamily ATPase